MAAIEIGILAINRRHIRAVLFTAVLTTGLACPAFAQESASPNLGTQRGSIIVTAQKRTEEQVAVAMPMQVFDGDEVTDGALRQIADVADATPGLTIARSFRGTPVYSLRGVGFNSPNLSATSPVGIYMDEFALPFPAMSGGPIFDIARIEVLKGPQGTLFGRSTTGGLINFVARKPEADERAELSGQVGSFSGYAINGAVNAQISDGVSARLAFVTDVADKGWQTSVTREARLGKQNQQGARLSLLANPSDTFSLLVTGNWWRDRSETQAPQSVELYPQGLISAGIGPEGWREFGREIGLPAAVFDQSFRPTSASQADWTASQLPWGGTTFTPAPLDFSKDNRLYSLSLRGDLEMGERTSLTLLSAYTNFRRNEISDYAGWNLENVILEGQGEITSWSHELRLNGSTGPLDWVAGLAHSRDRLADLDRSWVGTTTAVQLVRATAAGFAAMAGADASEQAEIFFGARDANSRANQTTTSSAIFGQFDYHLTTDFTLTAGLRYTADRTDFSGCSGDTGNGSLTIALNAFYNGIGIPADAGPGDCTTFLGDIAPSVLSGGVVPFPEQGLHRDRLSESGLSGRLALAWQVAPKTMVYGTLSRGLKAGLFPNIEANVASQYAPATRERLIASELGVKSQLTEWAYFDASVFYYDYRDKQAFGSVDDILFTALPRIVNIPRSHVYGLDASLAVRPWQGLEMRAATSLLHSRIDEYTGFDDFGIRRDFAGGSFPYSPRFQLVASAAQSVPIAPQVNGELGVNLRHSGASQGDFLGERRLRIRPYTEVDLRVSLKLHEGQTELSLLVRNITDSYHWNNVLLQTDSFTRYAAMPRRWTLELRNSF